MNCNDAKILDFKSVNINIGEFVKIIGIYNTLNSTNKVVMVKNLGVNGNILNDFYTQLIRDNNIIYLNTETFTITVSPEDVVSITTNPSVEPSLQIPITKIIYNGNYDLITTPGEYDVIFSSSRIDGVLIWADERGNLITAVADNSNVVNDVPTFGWGSVTLDVDRSKIIVEIY